MHFIAVWITCQTTGSIQVISVDEGKELSESLSRFDQFVQILAGQAEIIIDGHSFRMKTGDCIIIPANSNYRSMAHEKFKMLSTIIKSGYE